MFRAITIYTVFLLGGFNRAYAAIDPQLQKCTSAETIIKSNTGEIFSPDYPNNFPPNSDCLWRIEVDEGMHVVISFVEDSVNIPEYDYYADEDSCPSDYLIIYDGPSTSDTLIFDKSFCGSSNVRPVLSQDNTILVHFVSDGSRSGAGFKMIWNATEKCGDDEYRCHNGKCISNSFLCDDIDQCGDRSDEWKCSFPSSTKCGQQAIEPNFKWSSRIVGGNKAVPGSWPWTVSLFLNGNPNCGGTLINKKWVLTAAHCSEPFSLAKMFALVGAHNVSANTTTEPTQKKIAILSKIEHPSYNKNDLNAGYDISLLELAEDVTYSDRVHDICYDDATVAEPATDEPCIVVGWGRQAEGQVVSPVLRQVVVDIFSDSSCETYWRDEDNQSGTYANNLICGGLETGGGDSCQGDSGGPLICLRGQQWHQFGVVSYGKGCAQKGHPGFYTRVSDYRSWINTEIARVDAPCDISVSGCNVNANCRLDSGTVRCTCKDGFEGSGSGVNGCADIDECEGQTYTCSGNKVCSNTEGGYDCICKNGYELNTSGTECIDVNECLMDSLCSVNSECHNFDGGYTCECSTGYTYSGDSCVDIDECETSTPCSNQANTVCANNIGSYTCVCGAGYQDDGSGSCEDVDECAVAQCAPNSTLHCSICKLHSYCDNTIGSFICTCHQGYDNDPSNTACLKKYKLTTTLTDTYVFSTNLLIKESNDFIELANIVLDAIRIQYHRLTINHAEVVEFRRGSVIADIILSFADPAVSSQDVENARNDTAATDVILTTNTIDQCEVLTDYCKNNAQCILGYDNPICICTSLFEGTQCDKMSTMFIVTIAVSAFAFVCLLLLIIFICLYCTKKRQT